MDYFLTHIRKVGFSPPIVVSDFLLKIVKQKRTHVLVLLESILVNKSIRIVDLNGRNKEADFTVPQPAGPQSRAH